MLISARTTMAIDDKTRRGLEAAVFRRLVDHLRDRTDVQNIDLMNLAGFCRNCLSNWMKEEADAKGVAVSYAKARGGFWGMPYAPWTSNFQGSASPEQLEAMKKAHSVDLFYCVGAQSFREGLSAPDPESRASGFDA